LFATAKELNKLADLEGRVGKSPGDTPLRQRSKLAMTALIAVAKGDDTGATAALKQLRTEFAKLPLSAEIWERWPEYVAAVGATDRPGARAEAEGLLSDMAKKLEKNMGDKVDFPDRDRWIRMVRNARGRAQVAGLPDAGGRAFGSDPGLTFWSPVTRVRAGSRGTAKPAPHWDVRDGVVRHYPGHENDFFYLRVPLRGDFEVSAELTTFGWREPHIGYGGIRFVLMHDRKSYQLYSPDKHLRKGEIDPQLPELGDWYKFRLVVKDGTWTVFVNDRKVCEELLPADPDPWFMLEAEHQNTAAVKNLKITGTPSVPESLDLSGGFSTRGWAGHTSGQEWSKRGEEIYHEGARPVPEEDKPLPPRQYPENAIFYHRPMVEDGSVEYEFFYVPEKTLVHPALDRLTFLLDPKGVRVHWLTDGDSERTGLKRDNVADEPANRRGQGELPLKPKAWNRMKLTLVGDVVKLELNGTEIYQRSVESTNQRTFGLFHYTDDTDVRVRKVTYRGAWPREMPTAEKLFATAK
jgi:hypothetical protein